ncbi:endonuclease/exonuclease/phosphatase family protein [Paenibacillus shunpengii]|uniref:Endonuclease/exonuclease/phosphatase family protein n=1 Tax=Paenibacillus shunpengii TaxID=2054424 RepID=A0ABW5SKE0_9BACL
MKILTLNTHAWMEEDQLTKMDQLAEFIRTEDFDIVALQEVNQSQREAPLSDDDLSPFYVTDDQALVKADNYAHVLREQIGQAYYWTYIPIHVGFEKYDEGLAFLSKTPILDAFEAYVSEMRDYENYRTRKILGIKTVISGEETWFVNGHYGWWHDDESFRGQWDNSLDVLKQKVKGQPAFIMGDFNNAAHLEGEGYDYVTQSGWHDCYELAEEKDEGYTVVKAIAGWENNKQKLRIDYVFSNRKLAVKSSKVVLDGKDSPIVSDHSGVSVTI